MNKYDKLSLPDLKVTREELTTDLKYVERRINEIEGNVEEIQWTKLALHFINKEGEFLRSKDIMGLIYVDYPSIATAPPYKKRNYVIALSVALNKMVGNGELKKYSQIGVKGFYYGRAEWEINLQKLMERVNNEAELAKELADSHKHAYPQHLNQQSV